MRTFAIVLFIVLTLVLDIVNTDVQLCRATRRPLYRRQRYATSACNTSVTYDKVLLKHVTLLSKYVFTGKVFGVNTGFNGTRVYKVNIRRVLKGDLNEIGVVVKFGTARSLRFSDATVLVESALLCRPLRVRTYGIFLTEKKREEGVISLSLVVEPIVLTLRTIAIIEAAVKGETDIQCESAWKTMRQHHAITLKKYIELRIGKSKDSNPVSMYEDTDECV